MADTDTKPRMNQSERNSMVKVVKGRFEAVRRHASRTRDELKDAIFNRVMEDNRRKIEAAKRDMAKIEERAQKLYDDAQAVIAKHAPEGVVPGTASMSWAWGSGRDDRVRYVDVTKHDPAKVVEIKVHNDWFVEGVDKEVDREYKAIESDHGLGELALAQREQELVEEILLGGVNPDAAQDFLKRVPTLGALPSVEEIRRLPSGS